jgi:hypothetical protein
MPFFAGHGGGKDWHVGGWRGAPLVSACRGGKGALGCSVDFFFRGVVSGQYMLLRASPSLLVWWPWWCFFSSLGWLAAAGLSKVEQFSDDYWRRVSAFTLDSEDEGHPLPAASSSFVSVFTCSADPSGAVLGAGAAAKSRAPSGSWWRLMKDLIAFWSSRRVLFAKFPRLVCNFSFPLDLPVILHRRILMAAIWVVRDLFCSKKIIGNSFCLVGLDASIME